MHHHALFWRVALLHSQVLLHFFGGDLGTALFSCNVAQCTLFSNILGSSLLSIMEEIKKAYFMHGLEGGPHTNDTFDLIFFAAAVLSKVVGRTAPPGHQSNQSGIPGAEACMLHCQRSSLSGKKQRRVKGCTFL